MSLGLSKSLTLFASSSFFSAIVQVIKGKLMAIFLGPTGVGVYNQLTNVFNLMFNASSLGFRNGVIKLTTESIVNNDCEKYVSQYISVLIFLSLFSTVASLVAVFFASEINVLIFGAELGYTKYIVIVLLSVPLAVLANFYRSLMSGHTEVKAIVRSQILADLLSLIPFCIFIFYLDLLGTIIAFLCYQVLKLIIYIKYYYSINRLVGSLNKKGFSWKYILYNMKFGFSGLVLTVSAVLVNMYIASVVIKELGEAENGLYAMAMRVATLYLGAIYANASSHYFPLLTKAKSELDFFKVINKTGTFYLCIMPPLMVLLFLSGELIIELLFSSEFAFSALLLLLVLPGDLLRISAETVALPLLAKEKFYSYKSVYVFWAISFVFLSQYFIGLYGILGVALAYFISQIFNFFYSVIIMKVILKFKFDLTYFTVFSFSFLYVATSAYAAYRVLDVVNEILILFSFTLVWGAGMMFISDFRANVCSFFFKIKKVLR